MSSLLKRKHHGANLQPDSIDMRRPHLGRGNAIADIINIAREKQHVIIGGSPATGKSSLLELLARNVNESGHASVSMDLENTATAPNEMIDLLKSHGVTSNRNETEAVIKARDNNLWVLIDEAQNGYTPQFDVLWSLLFKKLVKYNVKEKLFVVVASTYDETLGASPVHFKGHHHFSPHVSEQEARELYQLHTKDWHTISSWDAFCDTLLSLSWITTSDGGTAAQFHIGVMIAGLYLLQSNFKNLSYTEDNALHDLRSSSLFVHLDRCFVKPKALPDISKEAIVENLMGGIKSQPILSSDGAYPFVRRGLLNEFGGFSCLAANWYYNAHFFPGRPASAPATLDTLVVGAVKSMSQLRLKRSRDKGNFPKEAAFQQLFNEAMNKLLPPKNSVLPELNTKATQNGKVITGELDFYVNNELKWSIELLKEGIGIGQHLARFHQTEGKYREVDTEQYLVVDLRGPRAATRGVREDVNRCTFYFEHDFSSCICKMRNEPEKTLRLQP